MEKNVTKNIYIYIFLYTHTHIYVYIYIYIHTGMTEPLCCAAEVRIVNQLYFNKKEINVFFLQRNEVVRTHF